ncbi:MAG: HAD family hydrolase [Alistipes sp.]|nr:HAD family hydrolase [Alistipes sp.]
MSRTLAIFDLDGTLLNTIGDLAVCCNHMLSLRGLAPHSYEEYCSFVGNGITRLVERALPEELRNAEYITAARKDFVEFYYNNIDTHTVAYEGITEVIKQLSEAGVTLAVASNKFHNGTIRLIEKFFGKFHWSAIYGNREGFPLKPDPSIVELIVEQCGATKQQTFMIGDSGVDIKTANDAGVHSIGVTWGFRSREELVENNADYIVNTPKEICSIILK